VTSAEPGAGKSTILVHLARTIALTGRQVIVVDSDLRNPCLDAVFKVPNNVGLSNVILMPNAVDGALQNTKMRGVRVLTSGPMPPYPAESLSSSNMKRVIDELTNRAEVVLLDSPPLLVASDALGLASMVAGVVLVVARGEATEKNLQHALRQLDNVGATVLGTVFNRARVDRRYTLNHTG
jgi:capsular exopolysaccharide synthesis family protein